MTFYLYVDVISLAVIFVNFLMGSLKRLLLRHFFFFFVSCIHVEYLSSDESDEYGKKEYEEVGFESGSAGTFSTRLGDLLRGIIFRCHAFC